MKTASLGLLLLSGLVGCGPAALESSARPGADVRQETPRAWLGADNQSQRIPGGETCVGWLTRLGIEHVEHPARPGVVTPVEVTGPIAGVSYRTNGQTQVVADCRLILALDWIGPSLTRFGIDEVRHSGAYVDRSQKSGRPSLHAQGLAIDLHSFVLGRESAVVERDFQRGLGDGCAPDAPELNRVLCELRRLRLFQEVITPDHDRDHHDHFHLAISPRSEHR